MHGLCVFFHFQFQMKIDGNSHRPELWLCVKRDVAPWLFMNILINLQGGVACSLSLPFTLSAGTRDEVHRGVHTLR